MTPDDPFGRKGEEQTDPFGRPIEEGGEGVGAEERSSPLWSGHTERAAEERPRFLPPTDAPPERREPRSSGGAVEQRGFLPPTDAPAEPAAWWAEERAPAAPGAAAPDAAASAADYMERVGAAVIDFLVRVAIIAVVTFAVAFSGSEDATAAAFLAAIVLLAPLYAPLAMSRWNGQTIGHRAVNTRIVTRHGVPVTGGKAVVREFLVKNLLVEVLGALLSLGIFTLVNYLWPLWDDRNEALHDKMTDTRVVKA